MIQNRARVLDALRAANFDPEALPPVPRGKACPAKAVARIGAKLSRDSFEHAWKALLADGELHRT
jgi:hypothetical protein